MVRKQPVKRASTGELAQQVSTLNTEIVNIPFMNGVLIEDVTPSSTGVYKIKHNLGRPYRGFFCLTGDPVYEVASNPSKSSELLVTSASTTSLYGLELLGTYTFSGAAASATLFSGLDGFTDNRWIVRGDVVGNTSSLTDVEWQPNGTSTGHGICHYYGGTVTHGVRPYTGGPYCGYFQAYSTSSYHAHIEAIIYAGPTGKQRSIYTEFVEYNDNTTSGSYGGHTHGSWLDSSTNITSLAIAASTTFFGSGSVFTIYRETTAPLAQVSRALSFWVY